MHSTDKIFHSWEIFVLNIFGVHEFWRSMQSEKKMLSRFLTKFEKYDLWSAEIFFFKVCHFQYNNFFFLHYSYIVIAKQQQFDAEYDVWKV